MKPVKLILQAFGPYPDRVEIDFRDAVASGLFGIYGQTGSGKSTIFSAMTFALFGEAAQPDQDAKSLRSHHAESEVPTSVEFIFEIGDQRFLAIRQPEQERPKARGEGMTSSSHEAWLFDVTEIDPGQIDEGNRGKIIEEKKVRAVDEAIVARLGYGASQFRQIVLLPQGRFEAFLSAKTRERADILRDLFDVSAYADLAAELKAKASTEENRIKTERHLCTRQLNAEGFESAEALAEGIVEAKSFAGGCVTGEAAARKDEKQARDALAAAEKSAEKFAARSEAKTRLEDLQGGAKRMEALVKQVKQAERALSLRDVAAQVDGAKKELGDAQDERGDAEAKELDAKRDAKATQQALQHEEARTGVGAALRRRLDDLNRFARHLNEAEGSRTALAEAVRAERKAKRDFDEANKSLKALVTRIATEKQALAEARCQEKRRGELAASIADLTARRKAAQSFEQAQQAVVAAQGQVDAQASRVESTARIAANAKDTFALAEQRLASAQALHLAAKLKSGEPCPVCGSCDHPAPATGGIEDAGRDKAFRESKVTWEKADQAHREAQQALAGLQAALSERKAMLDALEEPGETAAALDQEVAAVQVQQEALGPITDIVAAEAALSKLELDLGGLAQRSETLRGAWDSWREQKTKAQTALDTMLKEVPEDLRNNATLSAERNKTQSALDALEKARADAERAAKEAREKAIAVAKDYEAAKAKVTTCQTRVDQAEAQFFARLAAVGLKHEAYLALATAIATLEADREAVTRHTQNVKSAEDAVRRAEVAVAGLERPDVEGLRIALADANSQTQKATEARIAAQNWHQHLVKLRDSLDETLRKLDAAEQASAPLRNLAALVNGQNAQKVTLEIFAIWAMFDQVLEAANLRLGPMTSSRYQLEREPESGGRGAQGLGIRVLDTHTGKTRPTNTLSGGESFIAALSLALGLADVVESASGKVRLDTVFIDEGFGSLDAADGSGTLEQVLQVLTAHVSQNRAVGLISHVPQVQEVVPNGFYVRKGLGGSALDVKGSM